MNAMTTACYFSNAFIWFYPQAFYAILVIFFTHFVLQACRLLRTLLPLAACTLQVHTQVPNWGLLSRTACIYIPLGPPSTTSYFTWRA